MHVVQKEIHIATSGQGTYEMTKDVAKALSASGITHGWVNIFCRHTSCSLVLMENADPSARRDLEDYLNRLVPENDPNFTHTYEGADDMPSHIKMALTRSSENIPFSNGSLLLGTWQGIFLWEHRRSRHNRSLIITTIGE